VNELPQRYVRNADNITTLRPLAIGICVMQYLANVFLGTAHFRTDSEHAGSGIMNALDTKLSELLIRS